jgi:hypothetical protein
LRLGGDPALITQHHLTNTFEEFWYDEVRLYFQPKLCHTPRMDLDGDEDVDQEDFGLFQACITGLGSLSAGSDQQACFCADASGDNVVDQADYDVFQACATGPAVRWSPRPGCR